MSPNEDDLRTSGSVLHTSDGDDDPVLVYLHEARKHHTQASIARHLGVDIRTIRRWEVRQSPPPAYAAAALQQLLPLRVEARAEAPFTFIDLFAGIGGLRLPFDRLGGRCVYTSEWDLYALKTYYDNFRGAHEVAGDITKVNVADIPDHDLMLAGFPCQPFSIAGVSKKKALGRAHGFACEAQGTLFFDVARIVRAKQPRAFLLENVKNLQSHDRGRTFDIIRRTLTEELGYHIHVKVIDGAHFVPQHRERLYIVGFREAAGFDWAALRLPDTGARRLGEILHRMDGREPVLPWDGDRYFDPANRRVQPKYTLSRHLWNYLRNYAEKHRAKGNGFGYGLVGPDDIARTLSARYYKDGSEILIRQPRKSPRRLTPRECARLMGYPDDFRIPVSDTRAYKQFGNSVVVGAIEAIAKLMQPILELDILEPQLPLQTYA